jgi:murein DD-endopeptidase MepM/ murein hydrolase activator NlpD
MSSNDSGRKLERFFAGKGFYIVLFLCAAVIGVSAWMMADGNETMSSEDLDLGSVRVETVIITPDVQQDTQAVMAEETISEQELYEEEDSGVATIDVEQEEEIIAWTSPIEEPGYVWPVQGELERLHQLDTLAYDVTMQDWRTHEGVDISAALGSTVVASHSGKVEGVENSDLYGTVVHINHGDGTSSLYANLADETAVSVGQWVECGEVIGSVGTTALCEIAQTAHLHFATFNDGQSVDPLEYLPE